MVATRGSKSVDPLRSGRDWVLLLTNIQLTKSISLARMGSGFCSTLMSLIMSTEPPLCHAPLLMQEHSKSGPAQSSEKPRVGMALWEMRIVFASKWLVVDALFAWHQNQGFGVRRYLVVSDPRRLARRGNCNFTANLEPQSALHDSWILFYFKR
jgi:hypothetical protein